MLGAFLIAAFPVWYHPHVRYFGEQHELHIGVYMTTAPGKVSLNHFFSKSLSTLKHLLLTFLFGSIGGKNYNHQNMRPQNTVLNSVTQQAKSACTSSV